MAYERKHGDIAVFKNDKQGNENRPDYTGNGLDLDGNEIRIALWLKDGRNGKFMAGNIQRPREQGGRDNSPARSYGDTASPTQQEAQSQGFDLDDSIPF